MNMIFDNIYKEIELFFTINKIQQDFINYMKFENVNSETVNSYDIDNSDEKKVTISSNDNLSILNIKLQKKYLNNIYIPVRIHLGVGIVEKTNLNVIYLEKCFADMSYNENLELVDIDFHHCKNGYA